jgi:hypothetical protein
LFSQKFNFGSFNIGDNDVVFFGLIFTTVFSLNEEKTVYIRGDFYTKPTIYGKTQVDWCIYFFFFIFHELGQNYQTQSYVKFVVKK